MRFWLSGPRLSGGLIRVSVAVAAFLSLSAPSPADPAPAIHYAPAENLEHIDVGLLDSAKHEIDLAAYVLTDWPVIQALRRAAARGVKARVYLDATQLAERESVRAPRAIDLQASIPKGAILRPVRPHVEAAAFFALETPAKRGNFDGVRPARSIDNSLPPASAFYVDRCDAQGAHIAEGHRAHGLGHLLAPYDETPAERRARIEDRCAALAGRSLERDNPRRGYRHTRSNQVHGHARLRCSGRQPICGDDSRPFGLVQRYNARKPEGERIFPFGFLLSLQAKSRLEMAKDDPEALSHELWRRREPRPAAPCFKRAIDAKDHAFDRDCGDKIPASWLKSHGRSLARYHLHQETKFWRGEYDQRGPLRRHHVFALTHVPTGKESDQIEENEYIGEEAGPLEHPLTNKDHATLLKFNTETKNLRKITDRVLLGRAGVSAHTLCNLRKGVPISDKSLFQLVRAAEQLRQETDAVEAANKRWLQKLREFLALVGSQNKLAKLLGVSRPYLGRVLSGEKPITAETIERLRKPAVRPAFSVPHSGSEF